MRTVNFTGCDQLDYERCYDPCKKVATADFACWDRGKKHADMGYPRFVQFCKKRGRLNRPYSCTDKIFAGCDDYCQAEHTVEVEDDGPCYS